MGRLLFLLTTERVYANHGDTSTVTYEGALYRSTDGGMSWEALALPEDLVPSALAISPTFDQDGLIWLGTADGRIVPMGAEQLGPSP